MGKDKNMDPFSAGQLEGICKGIANGLTGNEIGYVLRSMNLQDLNPTMTKWHRIYNALGGYQNYSQSGNVVLTFISRALEPSKFINKYDSYIIAIEQVNKVLIFKGLLFKEDGRFYRVKAANTLSEAESRAKNLKTNLIHRNVHPHVLKYCQAELLKDNYFHAVLEACKSIASKIREITGLESDGSKLIDEAFGGLNPLIKINDYDSESKKSEQKGFVNLAKGLFGTFRNPTAHSARIEWEMAEDDALDLFVLASYIIRRIENT